MVSSFEDIVAQADPSSSGLSSEFVKKVSTEYEQTKTLMNKLISYYDKVRFLRMQNAMLEARWEYLQWITAYVNDENLKVSGIDLEGPEFPFTLTLKDNTSGKPLNGVQVTLVKESSGTKETLETNENGQINSTLRAGDNIKFVIAHSNSLTYEITEEPVDGYNFMHWKRSDVIIINGAGKIDIDPTELDNDIETISQETTFSETVEPRSFVSLTATNEKIPDEPDNPDNPPSGGDTYITVTAKKEWKLDDDGEKTSSVTAVLYKNGVQYATAELNESNNWTHTWNNLNDKYTWTVEEETVPEGFTSSVERSGYTFTITNDDKPKDTPEEPDHPDKPENPDTPDTPDTPSEPKQPDKPIDDVPQTGDSGNSALWIGLMALAAAGMTGTAIYGRKRRYGRR